MSQLNNILQSITSVDAEGDWATCYSPMGTIEITPLKEIIIVSFNGKSFQVPEALFETLVFPYSKEIKEYIARYAM